MASAGANSRHCGACYEDSVFTLENILQCQKVSDLLISLAYFSIPLELFYFATCSTILPFRWVILQFGAFIVLCGLTHLVATFTYAQHSFLLMLTLTVFKFLTALVSVATAATLATLIPQLLRLLVREGLLRKKTHELDREVGIMKRQEEAGWHVRMLTREIRRSLDRHTILERTLVELSKLLFLEYCGILMPAGTPRISSSSSPGHLVLTHEMGRRRGGGSSPDAVYFPIDDPEVASIVQRQKAVLLDQDSSVMRVVAAGKDEALLEDYGHGVAIRMPLLRASNFRGGALEQTHTSFAVLVLVLPVDSGRTWTEVELEIVEVVADQVTVALSHAAVLEESLAVKRQLLEQNAMLKVEQKNALVAKEARNLFQKVIIREIAKPVRTIKACLAMLQDEQLKADQHAMVKGGLTLSSLIEDFIEPLPFQNGLELKLRPFDLHSIIEEVWRASSLFCALKGLPFQPRFSNETPKRVVGDEFRILQALLYMVGYFVGSAVGDAAIVFDISVDQELRQAWKQNVPDDDSVSLNFKVGRADSIDREDINQKYEVTGEEVCLSLCKKLAELMHGNLSVSSVSQGLQININFQIRMKREQTKERGMPPKCLDQETALNLLGSMKVLLVDADGICRNLSRRVLERTGCQVTLASSWFQCLNFLNFKKGDFHLLLLDTKILKDGQDITGRIKKMKLDGWIRIIVLVSSNDSITLEECVQYGIHGVLCKPIVLQEMLEELHRISLQSQGMH